MTPAARRYVLSGTIQGVGFRPFVFRLATSLGLRGRVLNTGRGVVVEAEGTLAALDALESALWRPPAPARVTDLRTEALDVRGLHDFAIAASAAEGARVLSLPPDLATCPECAAEVTDPFARRHGYAFTNCTACGPRYTIATGLPYDRPATTMAGFTMCPECRAEYEDPRDRRFHAQPIACPTCGPAVRLASPDGTPLAAEDPIAALAVGLTSGGLFAVKGIGGFHLACDARSAEALARLRAFKRRERKPFAVMVADLHAAHEVAEVTPEDAALLQSVAAPIVLLPMRPGAVHPDVAPGLLEVGVMLAYTPLHQRLCTLAARPLVMTSGNRGDEPIATRSADAVRTLGPAVDGLLLHDRRIAQRADDSVVRPGPSGPILIRRARGYVPTPIGLPRVAEAPVLALGGQMKSTVCLVVGDRAFLSPHVGDLDHEATLDALFGHLQALERLTGVRPERVAHDLHPDYVTTTVAEGLGLPRMAVQHHHAHLLSVLAEHGLTEPVVGLAFDGTGYGPDGTSWGGEALHVDGGRYQRLGTLRALPLAGGERAIREPWRLALAALRDLGVEPPDLPCLTAAPPLVRRGVEALLSGGHVPVAHGAGRWFDVFGALVLGIGAASFEGEPAMRLEAAAVGGGPAWPLDAHARGDLLEVDLRPAVAAVLSDLRAGRAHAEVAARCHATMAEAAVRLARYALHRTGARTVVLSGGCFQNVRFTRLVLEGLRDVRVLTNRLVPPNDGGLSLGQAFNAALA